jgi:hypothetical protein
MRYLYQETTEEESREIDRALLCDGELKALYNELCEMVGAMDDAQLQPAATTVLSILSYSRHLQEKRTH